MSTNNIIKLNANVHDSCEHSDQLDAHMFTSAVPIQHTTMVFENEQIGLYIGVWDSTDMQEVAGPYSCDEFMYLITGSAEIKNNKTGLSETILENQAFVIPQGYDCQWIQKGYIRKFFIISERPTITSPTNPEVEGIVNLSHHLKQQSLVADSAYHAYYTDPTGIFSAGIWQGKAFTSESCSQAQNQLLFLLSGSLIIQDENNVSHYFEAGDCFFIAQNTLCSWQSSGDFQAFYSTVNNDL